MNGLLYNAYATGWQNIGLESKGFVKVGNICYLMCNVSMHGQQSTNELRGKKGLNRNWICKREECIGMNSCIVKY